MKRYFYKTYVEDVFSKTRMQMPDWLFRRLVEFEAFAADFGEDGLLPPVADMAWILRPVDETKLSEALLALSKVGEVEQTPEGGWRMTRFESRQWRVPEAERTRQSRLRKSSVATRNDLLQPGDSDVTDSETSRYKDVAEDVTPSSPLSPSESISFDSDSKGGGVGEGTVFSSYETNIGALTPTIADGLKADIDDYGVEWVLAGIDYAVKQEKRSLSYVEGTLRGWKRDGLSNPRERLSGSNGKTSASRESNQDIIRKVAHVKSKH